MADASVPVREPVSVSTVDNPETNNIADGFVDKMGRTWMHERLTIWHDSLSPSVEVQYVHGLQQLAAQSPLNGWSLCAGTGLTHLFLNAYSHFLKDRYNVLIEFNGALYCEHDPGKQAWLCSQMPELHSGDAILVSKLNELAADAVMDARVDVKDPAAKPRLLPRAFVLDIGVPCVSRTPLNCNAAKNIGCVARRDTSLVA